MYTSYLLSSDLCSLNVLFIGSDTKAFEVTRKTSIDFNSLCIRHIVFHMKIQKAGVGTEKKKPHKVLQF